MRRIARIFFVIFLGGLFSCNQDNGVSGDKPTVTGMRPAQVSSGQQNVNGTITGSNFNGIVAVDLGAGIKVINTKVNSAAEIAVVFSVDANATPGPRTIRIATPAGIVEGSTLFSVSDNKLPIAKFSIDPPKGSKFVTFRFDASDSSDPDGHIAGYSWKFGDNQTANGVRVSHKFDNAGTFDVELTVTDNHQGQGTTKKGVLVENARPPVAHFDYSPKNVGIHTNIRFDASSSTDDVKINSYHWTFGDGKQDDGRIVFHQFTSKGQFQVNLTVTNKAGLTDSVAKSVGIVDKPPVVKISVSPTSGPPGTIFHFDGSESSDPDGEINDFFWNFGDGASAHGALVSHQYKNAGNFAVSLVVKDNGNHEAKGSKSVSVQKSSGGGGGGGGNPVECTHPVTRKSPVRFGTITSVDLANQTVDMHLNEPTTCAEAFYKCGDVKDGYFNGKQEQFFGAICQMWSLGNNNFRIRVGPGKYWPPTAPDSGAWIHYQDCSFIGNYCK